MSKFKNIIFLFLLGLLLVPNVVYSKTIEMDLTIDGLVTHYASEEVFIKVDGKKVITKEMPPIIFNDRTLVPAREMFEAMGANVEWIQDTKEVNVTFENSKVNLKIKSPLAKVTKIENDVTVEKDITMDIVAQIINNKTMIPFRAVSEALGYEVEWIQETRTIMITSPDGSQVSNDIYVTTIEDEDVASGILINKMTWESDAKNVINKTVIEEEKNDACNILSIRGDYSNKDYATFTIKTDGSVSSIDMSELDNRIVLDIKNAKRVIDEKVVFTENNFATQLRSSEYDSNTVRCVFDLKSISAPYVVSMNKARTKIFVKIYKNEIVYASYYETDDEGVFIIRANSKIDGTYYRLTDSDRIYIDLENAKSYFGTKEEKLSSANYVSNIRTSSENGQTRFVLDTNGQYNFTQSKINDNTIKLVITKVTYDEEIIYSNNDSNTYKKTISIPCDLINNISTEDVEIVEDYMNGIYEIRFNKYYKKLGTGKFIALDSYLDEFEITYENGVSVIKFTPKNHRILAFEVNKKRSNFIITIELPGDKYDEVLILDAGHGNGNEGTTDKYYKGPSSDKVNIIKEDDITLDIVNQTYEKLNEDSDSNIKIYLTRESNEKFNDFITNYPDGNKYINGRAAMENNINADAFISIHINNMDLKWNEKSTPWQGTEVLYNKDENIDGENYNGLSNLKLATKLVDGFVELTEGNYKNKNGEYELNGEEIKHIISSYTYRVGVLRMSEIPSALLEIGFLNNEIDHENLLNPEYISKCADALSETIKNIFTEYKLNKN